MASSLDVGGTAEVDVVFAGVELVALGTVERLDFALMQVLEAEVREVFIIYLKSFFMFVLLMGLGLICGSFTFSSEDIMNCFLNFSISTSLYLSMVLEDLNISFKTPISVSFSFIFLS
jgi:hypothetical protein